MGRSVPGHKRVKCLFLLLRTFSIQYTDPVNWISLQLDLSLGQKNGGLGPEMLVLLWYYSTDRK